MNAAGRNEIYQGYKMLTSTLQLPLAAADNRPIYDRVGKLVSVPEHAQMFVAAVNLVNEIAESDDDIVPDELWERARKIVGAK